MEKESAPQFGGKHLEQVPPSAAAAVRLQLILIVIITSVAICLATQGTKAYYEELLHTQREREREREKDKRKHKSKEQRAKVNQRK